MNFGGHQTFHLRDNWIYKGLNVLRTKGDIFGDSETAVTELGVGTNMVLSIRYWLQAARLVKKDSGDLEISELGELLLDYDEYIDYIGTSWLLHYQLATNVDRATSWFWFFNKFGVSEFTAESALHYLEAYVSQEDKSVRDTTLKKDIDAILRMYLPAEYVGRETPEDNLICPLTQLGLLQRMPSGGYRINHPHADDIPVEIFGYVMIDFWVNQLDRVPEFSFEELINKDCGPAKIFCLTQDTTMELLDRLVEKFPKQFSYSRSGGFFNISIKTAGTTALINSYYGGQDGQA